MDDGGGSDGLALMGRALASHDPLELAVAGFLSGYKGKTFDGHRAYMKRWLAWCAQNGLAPLDAKRAHVELYLRWAETQGWSEGYVSKHFLTVRLFYRACVRDDILVKNPAEFVTAPKVHEEGQKRPFLTPLEFAAFLEASRRLGPNEHAAAALMGLSGLRVAEACGLQVESVVKPANIPLPIPVMRAVRAVIGSRTTGPLLRNQDDNALSVRDAERMVKRIAKVAGCRDITPHGLRRTFCTSGLVSGVPLRDMQIAMRHSDPRTTGIYDMAKSNKDRHASHRVASFLAGMTG